LVEDRSSNALELTGGATAKDQQSLSVVVCGSYRRGVDVLARDVAAFADLGCRVLSPRGVDFATEQAGFVYLADEIGVSPAEIEGRHLEALRASDLVWLHAPGGYLGPSGAFELGVAYMAGVPVYSRDLPNDATLRYFAQVADSPTAAVERAQSELRFRPGAPLAALQAYYARAASRRGWDAEGPAESMLLLTEEVGELARAVRRLLGLSRSSVADELNASEELADVQLYVVHLANVMGVDLAAAVTGKERENDRRARARAIAA
jgi:NTP pyrophosphatase (non-canonical NTP hydrolase)